MSVAENKAVVNRYFEEVHNQRAVAVLDENMAAKLLGPTRGVVTAFQSAFPDYHITITAQVAEEDLVVTVWRTTGTHQGEWPSPLGPIAPTSKSISFTGTTTLRVADRRPRNSPARDGLSTTTRSSSSWPDEESSVTAVGRVEVW